MRATITGMLLTLSAVRSIAYKHPSAGPTVTVNEREAPRVAGRACTTRRPFRAVCLTALHRIAAISGRCMAALKIAGPT